MHSQQRLTDDEGNRDLQRNESPDQTFGGIVHRLCNTDDKGASNPSSCNQKQRWKSYCLKCLTKETYDTLKLSGKKYSGKSFVCVILGEKEIIFKRKTFIF